MKPQERYDVIIVGAGSSGCVLAARLSENASRKVLVVEAGPRFGRIDQYPDALRQSHSQVFSLPGSPYAWPLMAQITPDIKYPVTRGKVFGGSSAVNGALFWRGTPADYDGWALAGNSEWSYEKVLPSFIRQETDLDFGSTEFHGSSGPVPVKRAEEASIAPVSDAFIEACVAKGFAWHPDMNRPDFKGIGLLPTNSVNGIRYNAAVTYLEPVIGRGNLTVLDRVMARRVLIESGRAIGIETTAAGGARKFFGDEVVLCAGAIKSPQLLLLSGIGPASMLRQFGIEVVHESPYVGKNLMDHPTIHITYTAARYTPSARSRPLAEVGLTLAIDGTGPSENLRLIPSIYSKAGMLFGMRGQSLRSRADGLRFLLRPAGTVRSIAGTSIAALRRDFEHRNELTIQCTLAAEASRGELRLASADPDDGPVLEYRYMSASADLRRVRSGVRLAVELLDQGAFRKLEVQRTGPTDQNLKTDESLDTWIMQHLGTTFHTSSTARMGPAADPAAVVDQYCRVHGLSGLRVVDLSILPDLVRRGPNATAMMLGERVAELFGVPATEDRPSTASAITR